MQRDESVSGEGSRPPRSSPEYGRWYYQQNKAKKYEQVRRLHLKKREWLRSFKELLECERCGFSHPAALDFHHRDEATKFRNVTDMVDRNFSVDAILAEIEKCDVLCANCHRILHHNQRTGAL